MNRTRHRKVWLFLAIPVLGLAVSLSAAGLVAARIGGSAPAASPMAPSLAVDALDTRLSDGYDLRRVFIGRVEADRTSGLGFERAGLLGAVLVREGASVAQGQILARLDTGLLQSRRREVAAAFTSAEADLALAEATLGRYRNSVEQGAVTHQALDEAREGARSARAAVELARARIASVDLDLAKSELRAPFEGVVIRRFADEGAVLAAGSPVIELQERATPEIRVGVAGRLVDKLVPGATYELYWRGRAFPAELRALLPIRALGTRTLDALFVPSRRTPQGLRPGELVELALMERIPQPGVWLPLEALTQGARGLWQVYALEPLNGSPVAGLEADHRVRPRPVELLYQEGDRVYVQGAIGGGERVARSGLHRIVPDQLVRALPEGADRIVMEDR